MTNSVASSESDPVYLMLSRIVNTEEQENTLYSYVYLKKYVNVMQRCAAAKHNAKHKITNSLTHNKLSHDENPMYQ